MSQFDENDPDLMDDPVDGGPVAVVDSPGQRTDEYVLVDDDDLTDDDVSPGTKRVNKRGLLITFGVMGLLLTFTIYQLMGMGSHGREFKRDEVVVDSLDSARSITSRIKIPSMPDKAVVVPPPAPEMPSAPPPAAVPPAAPVPAPRQLSAVAPKRPEGPDAYTLELMRLEQIRQKQFEAAITGNLHVRLDTANAEQNPYTEPGSMVPGMSTARNRSEMLAAVRAERTRTEAMIAGYGNDPTKAYRQRIAELNGGGFAAGTPSLGMSSAIPTSFSGEGVYTGSNPPDMSFEEERLASAPGTPAGGRNSNSAMSGASRRGNSLEDFDGDSSRWFLDSQVENPSQFMIRAGSVIPAVLLSGINSDLPGQIMAQVSENVYDTATGRYMLIPQGTRLIGGYSSEVQYGQNRVFVAWQRLVFPDGRAYDLGSQPGTMGAGYAGLRDRVNHHLMRVFGSALLMSAVVGGVSYSQDQGGRGNDDKTRMSDSLSEALGQQMGQVMVEMIRRNMNISPTIEIRPGFRLNVLLVKDVAFKSSYRAFDYEYENR